MKLILPNESKFSDAMGKTTHAIHHRYIQQVFDDFDTNSDGWLQQDELKVLLQHLSSESGHEVQNEEVQRVYKAFGSWTIDIYGIQWLLKKKNLLAAVDYWQTEVLKEKQFRLRRDSLVSFSDSCCSPTVDSPRAAPYSKGKERRPKGEGKSQVHTGNRKRIAAEPPTFNSVMVAAINADFKDQVLQRYSGGNDLLNYNQVRTMLRDLNDGKAVGAETLASLMDEYGGVVDYGVEEDILVTGDALVPLIEAFFAVRACGEAWR